MNRRFDGFGGWIDTQKPDTERDSPSWSQWCVLVASRVLTTDVRFRSLRGSTRADLELASWLTATIVTDRLGGPGRSAATSTGIRGLQGIKGAVLE
jgi:hypothetical protein